MTRFARLVAGTTFVAVCILSGGFLIVACLISLSEGETHFPWFWLILLGAGLVYLGVCVLRRMARRAEPEVEEDEGW